MNTEPNLVTCPVCGHKDEYNADYSVKCYCCGEVIFVPVSEDYRPVDAA